MIGLVISGCHRYVPVQPAQLRQNAQVRVVAPPGDTMVVRHAGGEELFGPWRQVAGRLTLVDGDTLSLRRATLRAQRTFWEAPSEVRVELREGRSLHQRQLDGGRTAFAILVPVVIIGIILHGVSTMPLGY